jgi:hypothetical protein
VSAWAGHGSREAYTAALAGWRPASPRRAEADDEPAPRRHEAKRYTRGKCRCGNWTWLGWSRHWGAYDRRAAWVCLPCHMAAELTVTS